MGEKQVIVISAGDDPPSISANFFTVPAPPIIPSTYYAFKKTTGYAGVTIKGYAVPAIYKTVPPEESPEGKSTGGNAMREWQSLAHVSICEVVRMTGVSVSSSWNLPR